MDANTRGAGADSPDSPDSPVRVPHCRVVWDAAGAEVGVWVANGDEPGWVRRQRVEVITEFADRALEHVRDELPGAEMAVDAVEALRDPRTIVSLTIAAVAQVAAVHAGIPVTAAKLIGDAAGRLGQRLLAGESDRDQDPAVRYLDFDYDTQACAPRPEDPAIQKAGRGSRHDAVGELLDRRGTQTRGDRSDRSDRTGGARRSRDVSRVTPQGGQPTSRAAGAGPGISGRVPGTGSKIARGGSQPAARGDRSRAITPKRQPRSRGGRGGR